MLRRLENWRRTRLLPSWLSVPLMILGAVYLVVEAWSIGLAALVPIGIVAIVGWIEYRHVRKVTLIEHSASHVVWRIDYRTKDPSNNR